MNLKRNYPLKNFNTFSINVDAEYFVEVASIEELTASVDFINSEKIPFLILGGGSNILFTQNFKGLVIKLNIHGIEVIDQDNNHVYIKSGAGENWDEFVQYCVDNKWGGLENLSLIPGNVGASPVQNIGAYGVEMKDHFYELEYFNIEKKEIRTFRFDDCNFGYRNSIFKNVLNGKGVVTSVTFKLDKTPEFKTSYGAISTKLDRMGVTDVTLKDLRQAVISIREIKLPDPDEIPNGGSFFKNPVIDTNQFQKIKAQFPEVVSYKQDEENIKLAAGWLIDQCNWKGKRIGDAGIHKNQALVLVNYGNASGLDIYELSEKIKQSVFDKFGVVLEREINVY
ncbi:MAG: UDP-N-acetylenolpyruvoylglucosamine reductase [Bacteroidetes bacterium]|nr:MAG: UDP-N-acetylenolpyruvoylglucosamine reductase [Bacteroidota bacterium]